MKMYRIVEELERQGIQPTYANIAIFAVFVAEEGLIERLELNGGKCIGQLEWLRAICFE